jgi:sulfite exporter TauE/SafE
VGLVPALAPFVALALLGSLHCAGMCGPLVLAATGGARRPWSRAALHSFGKALAYTLLAALLASAAAAVARVEPRWLGASRSALAAVAGATMVASGLAALGVPLGRAFAATPLRPGLEALQRLASDLPPPSRAFAFGLVNGLLPCGLSWSAIALAASSGGAVLVLGPLAFGLATLPALAAVAFGAGALGARLRDRGRVALGVVLIAAGAWTAWRGGVPWGDATGGPPCCETAAGDGAESTSAP